MQGLQFSQVTYSSTDDDTLGSEILHPLRHDPAQDCTTLAMRLAHDDESVRLGQVDIVCIRRDVGCINTSKCGKVCTGGCCFGSEHDGRGWSDDFG